MYGQTTDYYDQSTDNVVVGVRTVYFQCPKYACLLSSIRTMYVQCPENIMFSVRSMYVYCTDYAYSVYGIGMVCVWAMYAQCTDYVC